MFTLALDAAAGDATVAVLDGRQVLATGEAPLRDRQVDPLLPAVIAAIDRAGFRIGEVQRVVCGDGPGSFTALRMAGATAKGIVRATGAEFCVAPSLALVPAGAEPPVASESYLVLLDALRGECYAAHVVLADSLVTLCDALPRMPRAAALEYAMTHQMTPIGPDEALALHPHARGVARLADDGVLVRRVVAAQWEPAYGRLAEAQVRWEQAHLRPLPSDRGEP